MLKNSFTRETRSFPAFPKSKKTVSPEPFFFFGRSASEKLVSSRRPRHLNYSRNRGHAVLRRRKAIVVILTFNWLRIFVLLYLFRADLYSSKGAEIYKFKRFLGDIYGRWARSVVRVRNRLSKIFFSRRHP